jgi:hypothetical protein
LLPVLFRNTIPLFETIGGFTVSHRIPVDTGGGFVGLKIIGVIVPPAESYPVPSELITVDRVAKNRNILVALTEGDNVLGRQCSPSLMVRSKVSS